MKQANQEELNAEKEKEKKKNMKQKQANKITNGVAEQQKHF